ncbi:MAG: M24 family metallopeptidase [Chlamydiia bacterium]
MERMNRLYSKLAELKIDSLVVTKPTNIYYLFGIDVSVGMLVVQKDSYVLYLDSRYTTVATEKGFNVSDKPLKERLGAHKQVVVEGDHLTFAQFQDLQKHYPSTTFTSKMVVEELRMIKEPSEIAFLREAGRATAEMMQKVIDAITEGVSEEELETLVLHPSFTPIIAFGSHAAHIHHRPTAKRYQKGDTALIDLGVKRNHYMGDMTRTIHSPLIARVKEGHDIALAACKPGVTVKELDALVKQKIPFKDHSLSHGIGLEVHEKPLQKVDVDLLLRPNMCITIEPGLYEPGVGGARYENMVLITDNGCEILTV